MDNRSEDIEILPLEGGDQIASPSANPSDLDSFGTPFI